MNFIAIISLLHIIEILVFLSVAMILTGKVGEPSCIWVLI